jgi:hypothetical protein
MKSLTNWLVPTKALQWGDLDGYLPHPPKGMAWYRQFVTKPAPAYLQRQGQMRVIDRTWWKLGQYPPAPPPRGRRR